MGATDSTAPFINISAVLGEKETFLHKKCEFTLSKSKSHDK